MGVEQEAKRATLRQRIYREVEPRALLQGLSLANRVIAALIILATVLAILETEPLLARRWGSGFAVLEWVLGSVFAIEYVARVWVAPEGRPAVGAWRARVAFVTSPIALADLIAIASAFAPIGLAGGLFLRWLRLARIIRLAKLGRMSQALDHMVAAVVSRRDELLLSLTAGVFLLMLAATALYLVEGAVQPDKFGSIPRALWWAVATMTTIGYGDVYPITPLGKVLASFTAIFSIGLIAMPTGILAAAFSDAMRRHRNGMSEPAD